MTFNDIFKTNFLERINSFSIVDACIVILLAFVIGLFIFVIYRKTYAGVMYSKGFGISLIAMAMITTFIILAVTSNVVLSLGMVGALSIVRFRTAIKDPMDIVFLFWSLAVGIVLGAGLIPLAVIGSVMIGIIILIFSNVKYNDIPYIVVINCTKDVEKEAESFLKHEAKRSLLKARSETNAGIELTYEIRIGKNKSAGFLSQLKEKTGADNVMLVSYNGEYMA